MIINIISFYKIKKIKNLKNCQNNIKKFLLRKFIRGTIIISPEGINGTISGKEIDINESLNYIKKKIVTKKFDSKSVSKVNYQPFFKPKIKIKKEVVPIGLKLTSNEKKKNSYIEPKNWNKIIKKKNVLVIDIRKPMEYKLGTFKNAIDPNVQNFRQFPSFFKKINKNKEIAMFCTGGIRCEKASFFLRKKGFKKVYQLKGGILNYLNKVNIKKSLWKGECFVFDNRVTVKHKLIQGKYKICSACRMPISPKDKKSRKYDKDISCPYCYDKLTIEKKKKLIARKKQKENLATTKVNENK
tara:strand:+ start:750 stop:1646 length:897 start_codon:yes stop_codon:yes gene_type:complete